jgi:hypothetical protein
MKNLFTINEEEKNRILNLHENATKRQYLSEQANMGFDVTNPYNMVNKNSVFNKDGIAQGPEGDPYQYRYLNDKVYYSKKSEGTNPKWVEVKKPKGIEAIKTKIFNLPPSDGVKISSVKTTPKKDVEKTSDKNEKKAQVSKYNFTPRIDAELKSIIDRNLDSKPFFIYDPLQNLLYLFDSGGFFSSPKLVDYTSVVDGADAQKDATPFTMDDWCKVSKLKTEPYKCTDPKTGKELHPFYSSLSNISKRFLPKGIYSVSNLSNDKGYVGSGKNVFSLKDSEGDTVVNAIHGIPSGLPERLTASADLESLLKKNISSGQVPQQYLDSIKKIAYANQSFGCIGVPAKFIDNPEVKKLAKGANVFVMGESKGSFLVQNSSDFFDKLHGDGQQCVDPIMLAQSMSEKNTGVA